MPLTRMTNTALNPDECLEPGVYEEVLFPAIDYSIDMPQPYVDPNKPVATSSRS